MKQFFVKELYWLPSSLGIAMVIITSIHRSPLDPANPEPYTTSPLVLLEMLLMTTICFFLFVWFILALVALFKRKKRDLIILLINIVFGFILMVTGLIIDAPALLFMP